jgi:hypothetical protein
MDLIDVILIFVFGLAVGWYWHATRMFNMLSRNPNPMIDLLTRVKAIQEEDNDEILLIECRVEWIGEQCYVWDNDTGDFLGQGLDLESAMVHGRKLKANAEYYIPEDLAKRPN